MSRASAPPDQPDRSGERIAKLLARAGIASRREVERMIAEGRIALNGEAVATPATVLRSLAGVTVDGQPVAAPAPARLFVYHKPPGLLVTERDPGGRPTIYDRLPAGLPRVVPVGRLDLATEGLLLLTTDGGLKRTLELPANGVERTYRARAYGQVSQAQLEDLIEGVEVEGIRYGSIDANLERRTGANVWIELTLTEGKNREVRRVLEHLGLQVGRLIRTRYGPFVLGDLQPGDVGEVRQHDVVAFRQVVGGRKAASTLPERIGVEAMAVLSDSGPGAETPASPKVRVNARPAFTGGKPRTSAGTPRAGRRDGDAAEAPALQAKPQKRTKVEERPMSATPGGLRRGAKGAASGAGARPGSARNRESPPPAGDARRGGDAPARSNRSRSDDRDRTPPPGPATKSRAREDDHRPTGKGRGAAPRTPRDGSERDRSRPPRGTGGTSDRTGAGQRGRPAPTRRGPPPGRR